MKAQALMEIDKDILFALVRMQGHVVNVSFEKRQREIGFSNAKETATAEAV